MLVARLKAAPKASVRLTVKLSSASGVESVFRGTERVLATLPASITSCLLVRAV